VFRLNPESPHGHRLQGLVHYRRANIQEAVRDLKRANMLTPNNPDVLATLSYFYMLAGRSSVAKPLLEKLLEIDPLTPINYAARGFLEIMENRFTESLEYYRKIYELSPESPVFRLYYAWSLAASQRRDDALSVLETFTKEISRDVISELAIFFRHTLRGEADQAMASVPTELVAAGNSVEYIARMLMEFYALLGAKTEALDWMKKDVQLGFINYPYLAVHSPFLSSIRGEERFVRILNDVKASWERFEP